MNDLNVNTGACVVGFLIGAGLFAAAHFAAAAAGVPLFQTFTGVVDYFKFMFANWVVWVLYGLTIIFYIIATVTVRNTTGTKEQWSTGIMRGLLIAISGGLNVALIYNVWSALSPSVAIPIAFVMGGLLTISIFGPISRNKGYQAIIGWSAWLLPLNWIIQGASLGIFLFNWLLYLLLGLAISKGTGKPNIFTVGGDATALPLVAGKKVKAYWLTFSFFQVGGLFSNLNPYGTAWNLGVFGFIDRRVTYADTDLEHEAGHALNLNVFGWVFHLIAAVDEVVSKRGTQAFAEVLAQSHSPTSDPKLLMW